MKRSTFLFVAAFVSALVAAFGGVRGFVAGMSASSLVGVPSRAADQRHFGHMSWFWCALAAAALVVFFISMFAIIRDRSS